MKDWVWGVDVSTKQADLACVCEDGSWTVATFSWPVSTGAQRLDLIRDFVAEQASHLSVVCPPTIVMVEMPIGKHQSPSLMMAAGAIAAAIYGALKDLWDHPVSVMFANVSDWKKHSVGHSNASKAQVYAWAAALGYQGSQDGADALGIATYAARTTGCGPGPLARSEAA